jgi:hypothetical protein
MNYLYRCEQCTCEWEVQHPMGEDPVVYCGSCKDTPTRKVIRPERAAARVRNGGEGYQPGLSRFPNDPRAYVDGPHSLQKLVSQRRRETGADPISPAEVHDEHVRELSAPWPDLPWDKRG